MTVAQLLDYVVGITSSHGRAKVERRCERTMQGTSKGHRAIDGDIFGDDLLNVDAKNGHPVIVRVKKSKEIGLRRLRASCVLLQTRKRGRTNFTERPTRTTA